ncbi:MAG: GvpL/GvpF family gas vesicle protein [Candidatus Eisenbacteria bacterium]|nr:GvpL/GvpF family gas vesicle protein [Candidatus Eisenbacteria bacterium]
MKHEGKYVYGIIAAEDAPNFGPIGIGGHDDEVTTIGTRGIAAVVSRASTDHFVVSMENLTAHIKVVERIMESYTVLPMRFCTVAETADEIIAFLEKNSRELKGKLKDLDGKVEIDIKIVWTDMKKVYEEIVKENRRIRALKTKETTGTRQDLIRAGELVATALEEKKAVEGDRYLRLFKKAAADCKEDEPGADEMVAHAAFLIDKGWLKEFNNTVEGVGEEFKERIQIHCVGPLAPFSFVNLQLHWVE